MENKKFNLIISFATYPRDGILTYKLLENTFNSLIKDQDLSNINIKILVVGDDYSNIEELKPIFKDFDTDFYNINIDDALRNKKDIPFKVKWMQAVQRSKIFILNKAINMDYDYILMSADDEIYLNKKIETSIEYIQNHNQPDFIFSLGKYISKTIIPKEIDIDSYPKPGNCISSGTLYKLKNKNFINTIINFRKSRWNYLENIINKNQSFQEIQPEDAELWEYLRNFFIKKEFTSILIPIVLIDHITEKTLKKYIN